MDKWQKATCGTCGIVYYGFTGQDVGKVKRECRSRKCWPNHRQEEAPVREMTIEDIT